MSVKKNTSKHITSHIAEKQIAERYMVMGGNDRMTDP